MLGWAPTVDFEELVGRMVDADLEQVAHMTRPRVAIAHDYLTQRGGAERVVLALHRAFPEATIHTTLYDPDGTYPEFRDARIETSPLNRVGPAAGAATARRCRSWPRRRPGSGSTPTWWSRPAAAGRTGSP